MNSHEGNMYILLLAIHCIFLEEKDAAQTSSFSQWAAERGKANKREGNNTKALC